MTQTSNSRLTSELCCKDQIRSNNNSALLDTTRSPNYDDLPPPMEIVCEEEPCLRNLTGLLTTPRHSSKEVEAMTIATPAGYVSNISPLKLKK